LLLSVSSLKAEAEKPRLIRIMVLAIP